MQSIEEFLAYAVKLEEEAALRFGELADAMHACGNTDVSKLFRRLSDYSRLHLADARARSGFRDIPVLTPADFVWPDLESPETAAIWAADPFMGCDQALQVALEAESASRDYYRRIADTTEDPEIRVMAVEFAEEEAEHVAELQKWIGANRSSSPVSANG
jgi:rubrerythrin